MSHEVKQKAFQGRYFRTSRLKIWRFIEGYTFLGGPFSSTEKTMPTRDMACSDGIKGVCFAHFLHAFSFRLSADPCTDKR